MIPGSSKKAPVKACNVALQGNCSNLKHFRASYAAGFLTYTANAIKRKTVRYDQIPII